MRSCLQSILIFVIDTEIAFKNAVKQKRAQLVERRVRLFNILSINIELSFLLEILATNVQISQRAIK